MGMLKYIFMIIAALAAYQMLSGEGGVLTYNAKKDINTDASEIKKTLDKVLDSQKEFQKQTGTYAFNIAGPFIKGSDGSGVGYVAELDSFADKIYNEDGSQFDPHPFALFSTDKPYVLEKGVKIYTAPIYEIVSDGNGSQEQKTSFKIFVDARGYSSNASAVMAIEREICAKLKKAAGEFRTKCGTTSEKITSFSNSSDELTLTEKNAQAENGDGFVSATIVEKYKI